MNDVQLDVVHLRTAGLVLTLRFRRDQDDELAVSVLRDGITIDTFRLPATRTFFREVTRVALRAERTRTTATASPLQQALGRGMIAAGQALVGSKPTPDPYPDAFPDCPNCGDPDCSGACAPIN